MLFNSLLFLIFFGIVTISYFLVTPKYRWVLLLGASCYFYMVFVPIYILILGGTIVIDYFAGIFLERMQGRKRKWFLIASLIANVGVLAIFKYYNFLNENLTHVLGVANISNPVPFLSILLPIGLSFHTFQAMSYTIEVYRGNQKAEKHFGIYSLYVMFYPQLVAGPIERPQNLLHQFHTHFKYDWEKVKSGLTQMAWGLFKKIVIADRLSMVVDAAYKDVPHQSGMSMLIAVVFYSFQIYCDFSGYSDVAIGAARVMGFTLMDNFKTPYFSKSIAEFWKRWHISLSTWFKDYLYISLGGNRVSKPRMYFNLFFVFLVSGLWHGASWNFVIWGALHGSFLILAIQKDNLLNQFSWFKSVPSALQKYGNIVITFLLVTAAWVFFRSNTFGTSIHVFKKLSTVSFADKIHTGLNTAELIFSVLLILFLLWKEQFFFQIETKSDYKFWTVLTTIIIAIYFFGVFSQNQFIYFQF